MKNLLWFALGLAGGFVAAHYVNKDPRGHELLAEVDARISQFTDRIADARKLALSESSRTPWTRHRRRSILWPTP